MEVCHGCGEKLYPLEKMSLGQKTFHKSGCAKCFNCKVNLTPNNFAVVQGRLYCKTHYLQNFSRSGGRYSFSLSSSAESHVTSPTKKSRPQNKLTAFLNTVEHEPFREWQPSSESHTPDTRKPSLLQVKPPTISPNKSSPRRPMTLRERIARYTEEANKQAVTVKELKPRSQNPCVIPVTNTNHALVVEREAKKPSSLMERIASYHKAASGQRPKSPVRSRKLPPPPQEKSTPDSIPNPQHQLGKVLQGICKTTANQVKSAAQAHAQEKSDLQLAAKDLLCVLDQFSSRLDDILSEDFV